VPNERILGTLRQAVQAQTKVRIVYRRGDAATSTERVVHPYAVLPVRGAWFLIAHCERNDGMRFFRADRIGSAALLDEHFERPSGLALDEILSAERIFSGRASEELVVRYSPRIARWIAEREAGDTEADGSFVVRHPLADDAWAVRHVLQYGPEAEVLEPTRIRERLAATLNAMVAI
jgi:predicted DNA-binding transcriptional regulator YafY